MMKNAVLGIQINSVSTSPVIRPVIGKETVWKICGVYTVHCVYPTPSRSQGGALFQDIITTYSKNKNRSVRDI